MQVKLIVFCALVIFTSACSSNRSPWLEGRGKQFLFASNDEKSIFEAVHSTLNKVGTENGLNFVVTELDDTLFGFGPIKGYQLRAIVGMSSYTTTVRIYPASGVSGTGEILHGYYPEVFGLGTIIGGSTIDEKAYYSILSTLEAIAPRVTVLELRPYHYQVRSGAY